MQISSQSQKITIEEALIAAAVDETVSEVFEDDSETPENQEENIFNVEDNKDKAGGKTAAEGFVKSSYEVRYSLYTISKGLKRLSLRLAS